MLEVCVIRPAANLVQFIATRTSLQEPPGMARLLFASNTLFPAPSFAAPIEWPKAETTEPRAITELDDIDALVRTYRPRILRFQSYNIEMVEVIGGRFWKPYASKAATAPPPPPPPPAASTPPCFEQRTPSTSPTHASASSPPPSAPPTSASLAPGPNTVYFHDSDAPAPPKPPEGFGGVLTRAQWKSVVAFYKAVDAPIVTSFSNREGAVTLPPASITFLTLSDANNPACK